MTEERQTQQAGGAIEEPGLVSVIVIFLNEERFLREAVESVRAQSYPRWELLLVDDGSTDDSSAMAQAFAREHPGRIRYLTHPGGGNRGMSASRNLGLEHARGEYVAFLDADDLYLPERLARHVGVLSGFPAVQMTVSDHIRWFTAGEGAGSSGGAEFALPFFAVGDQVWHPPLGLMVILSTPFLGQGICNVTVRRRTAIAVGGFDATFRALYEDQVFLGKILAGHPVYVLQEYLARYRHHPASVTRRLKESGRFHDNVAHEDTNRFADWLMGHVQTLGVGDPLLLGMIGARRAAGAPSLVQRLRVAVGARCKQQLRGLVPLRWYRRLLLLDYEIKGRRAKRKYSELAAILSRRALERARQ